MKSKLMIIIFSLFFLFLTGCFVNMDRYPLIVSYSSSFVFSGKYTNMVSVTGGTFVQESTAGYSFSHTISSFQIAKYETTYELWYTVHSWAITNGYTFANVGREGDGYAGVVPTSAKYEPVTRVNWRDVIVWCNAYSEMSGFTACYTNGSGEVITNATDANGAECDSAGVNWSANGYRMPTEGEWQYAASYIDGSSWTPCDYASGATSNYSNASACQEVAWYGVYSGSMTHDVGTKTANALGIYDMSGNVSEWCWDWYGTYHGASTNYRGSVSGSGRVVRGGSWGSIASVLQVGNRDSVNPDGEIDSFGFRLARSQ